VAAAGEARLCIRRFRILREACIPLRRATVLVGQAAGKTSVLEALAVIGYGVKHVYETGAEYSTTDAVGSLGRYLRGGCGAVGAAAEAWLEAQGRRVGARLLCRGGEDAMLEYYEAASGGGEQTRATIVTVMAEKGAEEPEASLRQQGRLPGATFLLLRHTRVRQHNRRLDGEP
jgi:hypothetical protein